MKIIIMNKWIIYYLFSKAIKQYVWWRNDTAHRVIYWFSHYIWITEADVDNATEQKK